ncbi:uncharacterized protein UV8b_04901 [Ustilaginoidea virens]|uniref:Uncharacterized protein n=1 Tax=Ustilaginoidea virens TaxID=1159556 RepID=A0A8E5HS61_USTVR|nr:uncharacterized protein UV8b_04901 [Ustilaginoidea virens]QUC20660.1 hypothetical protein UV8b_04901 [Ustilaginoidea virens]
MTTINSHFRNSGSSPMDVDVIIMGAMDRAVTSLFSLPLETGEMRGTRAHVGKAPVYACEGEANRGFTAEVDDGFDTCLSSPQLPISPVTDAHALGPLRRR